VTDSTPDSTLDSDVPIDPHGGGAPAGTREAGLGGQRARAIARRTAQVGLLLFWCAVLGLLFYTDLGLLDVILLSVLLVAVPTMSVAQIPLIGGAHIDRLPAYWSSIATLWLIGTACWFVGTRAGGAAAIGLVWIPILPMVGWTAGLTLAALLLILVFRALGSRVGRLDSTLLRQLLPVTRQEKGVFALLSVAAGVGEEVAYRGYVIPILAPITGLGGAAIASTIVFGIMHGYQGAMGIARTTLMGGVLAWGFIASGSLWPPILAHVLIDLLAGIVLGERLLVPEPEVS
jgi:membrane protease YdiL (CAAX protease family)